MTARSGTRESSEAARRAEEAYRADREELQEMAWRVLNNALDAADANELLEHLIPKEKIRELLAETRDRFVGWTPERARRLILARAYTGQPFSANRFYVDFPPQAHHLIGPALQSLRHGRFETLGTEIAISPARKMSRVTVYRLLPGIRVPDRIAA